MWLNRQIIASLESTIKGVRCSDTGELLTSSEEDVRSAVVLHLIVKQNYRYPYLTVRTIKLITNLGMYTIQLLFC